MSAFAMKGRDGVRALLLKATLVGLVPAALAGAAPASNPDLAHCAALTASEERLACYDSLTCAGIGNADERLACYDKLAKARPGRPAPAPAAGAAPTPSAAGTAGDASFGVVRHANAPKPAELEQIKAVVSAVSVDRMGTVSVALQNGQTWAFHDPEAPLKAGDEVTIKKGALGSFLMTTPARHTYRVQRTQ